jgi:hypothetical protein
VEGGYKEVGLSLEETVEKEKNEAAQAPSSPSLETSAAFPMPPPSLPPLLAALGPPRPMNRLQFTVTPVPKDRPGNADGVGVGIGVGSANKPPPAPRTVLRVGDRLTEDMIPGEKMLPAQMRVTAEEAAAAAGKDGGDDLVAMVLHICATLASSSFSGVQPPPVPPLPLSDLTASFNNALSSAPSATTTTPSSTLIEIADGLAPHSSSPSTLSSSSPPTPPASIHSARATAYPLSSPSSSNRMLRSAFFRLDEQFIENYSSKNHFERSGEKAVQQQQWWDRDRLLIGLPQDSLSPSQSR